MTVIITSSILSDSKTSDILLIGLIIISSLFIANRILVTFFSLLVVFRRILGSPPRRWPRQPQPRGILQLQPGPRRDPEPKLSGG